MPASPLFERPWIAEHVHQQTSELVQASSSCQIPLSLRGSDGQDRAS